MSLRLRLLVFLAVVLFPLSLASDLSTPASASCPSSPTNDLSSDIAALRAQLAAARNDLDELRSSVAAAVATLRSAGATGTAQARHAL